MSSTYRVKSVAVIGAGAAGAVSAAALAAEGCFDTIRVFERRESAGGTWIYDFDPGEPLPIQPGKVPPEVDPPLKIPSDLPRTISPSSQQRYDKTPIYAELTSNVPDIAMSFADERFLYGPFVPHWVVKQYIENYFSTHRIDSCLVLNTTVEDVSRIPSGHDPKEGKWQLTLRRYDPSIKADSWWSEDFDALILANGHYAIPYVPNVNGLPEFIQAYPSKVTHSKLYRTPSQFRNKRVLVIGNSASGHDITTQLLGSALPKLPVYQSIRTPARWDANPPPPGLARKPVIEAYLPETNTILFADGTHLADIDAVIYCTGYKPSFPFWNSATNGGPLYDYAADRLIGFYLHGFSCAFPRSLGIVGLPRVLTFRSFEYQAVALARLFTGKEAGVPGLPPLAAQVRWERERAERCRREGRRFHDVQWDNGETMEYFREMYELAGLPSLEGQGRCPPVLDERTRWAVENVRKYAKGAGEGGSRGGDRSVTVQGGGDKYDVRDMRTNSDWVVVDRPRSTRDTTHFI